MFKNKFSNFFATIILILVMLVLIVNFPKGKQYIYANTLSSNIGDLSDVSTIRQTFYANDDNLFSIGIIFGKYMGKYNSDIEVSISDNKNNIIAKKNINGRNIKEGKFTYIYFDEIKDSAGKEYNINIKTLDNNTQEKITIYSSEFNDYVYGDLYIDEEKKNFDISFMAEYKKSMKNFISEINNYINSSIIFLIIVLVTLFISLFNLIKIIFDLSLEGK